MDQWTICVSLPLVCYLLMLCVRFDRIGCICCHCIPLLFQSLKDMVCQRLAWKGKKNPSNAGWMCGFLHVYTIMVAMVTHFCYSEVQRWMHTSSKYENYWSHCWEVIGIKDLTLPNRKCVEVILDYCFDNPKCSDVARGVSGVSGNPLENWLKYTESLYSYNFN